MNKLSVSKTLKATLLANVTLLFTFLLLPVFLVTDNVKRFENMIEYLN